MTVRSPTETGISIARRWNEQNLTAIRIDFPDPTKHARNLFYTSTAMWDAWAAYDPVALGFLYNESATAPDVEAARREAVSYAAFRVLYSLYASSVNASTTLASLTILMTQLGYDPNDTNSVGPSATALGRMQATSAIGPLIDVFEAARADEQSFQKSVRTALVKIVGSDFGPDTASWRRWWTANARYFSGYASPG